MREDRVTGTEEDDWKELRVRLVGSDFGWTKFVDLRDSLALVGVLRLLLVLVPI